MIAVVKIIYIVTFSFIFKPNTFVICRYIPSCTVYRPLGLLVIRVKIYFKMAFINSYAINAIFVTYKHIPIIVFSSSPSTCFNAIN